MHTSKRNRKKRGMLEAGAVLGALLLFMNVSAAPLSGRNASIQTGSLQTEALMMDAAAGQMKINSITDFEYKETVALLDQKIMQANREIILNGDAAEAIELCERFYTAADFEALQMPKVSALEGARLLTEPGEAGSEIHTFDGSDSVTVLYRYEDSNFYYVEYKETYRGYVEASGLDMSILSEKQIEQVSEINRCRFAAIASGDIQLHAGPSEYAEIQAIIENGVILTVVDVQDEWLKVSVADSTGYVKKDAVTPARMLTAEVDAEGYIKSVRAELELKEKEEQEQREKEAAERAAQQAVADENAEGSYDQGAEETQTPSSGGATSSGSTGNNVSSSVGSAIASTALNYLGVPYVYGGSSPSGFDCSGLVYYSAMVNGIALPRCADDQYYAGGTYVSYADLAVGDLVFFSADWSNEIEHVGIYVGGGQFVHAPHTGDVVKISTITDYYARNYWGALRLG